MAGGYSDQHLFHQQDLASRWGDKRAAQRARQGRAYSDQHLSFRSRNPFQPVAGPAGFQPGQAGGFFPQVPAYPTTPVPLTAQDFQEFAERRASVSRNYKEAQAQREAGRQRLEVNFERFVKSLGRQRDRSEREMRTELAADGLAFQPRFMGRGLKDLRDATATAEAEGRADLADQMAALDEAVRLARMQRDEELAAIERDRARRQSRIDALMNSLGIF